MTHRRFVHGTLPLVSLGNALAFERLPFAGAEDGRPQSDPAHLMQVAADLALVIEVADGLIDVIEHVPAERDTPIDALSRPVPDDAARPRPRSPSRRGRTGRGAIKWVALALAGGWAISALLGPVVRMVPVAIVALALVYVPLGLWRKRIGRVEFLGGLPLVIALFGATYVGFYRVPTFCSAVRDAPYLVALEGPGVPRDGPMGSLDRADDWTISIGFSTGTDRLGRAAPVTLVRADRFVPARADDARTDDEPPGPPAIGDALYIPLGLAANAPDPGPVAGPATIALSRAPVFAPVFARGDDGGRPTLVPAGVLDGEVTLDRATTVRPVPFHLSRPRLTGNADSANRRQQRYRHED